MKRKYWSGNNVPTTQEIGGNVLFHFCSEIFFPGFVANCIPRNILFGDLPPPRQDDTEFANKSPHPLIVPKYPRYLGRAFSPAFISWNIAQIVTGDTKISTKMRDGKSKVFSYGFSRRDCAHHVVISHVPSISRSHFACPIYRFYIHPVSVSHNQRPTTS